MEYTDVPAPEINKDDVLIKVYATSINPVDWKVREGKMEGLKLEFPFILGWDVSGVIEKVGADVTDFKPGDEVYGRPDISRNGTYAEYVAVKANEIWFKPKSLDHKTAGAIPLAGLTAWQGIFDHGNLKAGQRILIHGASGGVGTFAVQFAKWKGAYVIGTASADNIQFLKELGADEVIDYKNEDFSKALKDVDVVFDTIGGETQAKSIEVIKPDGVIVSTIGIQNPDIWKAKHVEAIHYMAKSIPHELRQLADLFDEGKFKVVVAKVLPLKDVKEAHQLSQEGHTHGKIVINVVE